MQQPSHAIRNVAIGLLAVVVTAGIFIGVRNHNAHAGKVKVAVYVLPENATVTIGGQQYGEGGAYITPGNYTARASSPGFDSTSLPFTVSFSIKDPVINIALNPASSAAQAYYNKNQALYQEREGLGSQQAHQQSSLIFANNPLIRQLPYSDLLYTIGYENDNSDPSGHSVIIDIDAPIGLRNAAVDQIRKLGYDPTDYRISFENYVNPFAP